MNEYIISKLYYQKILSEIRRRNPKAQHKDVIAYFNQAAGILGGVSSISFLK